METCISVISYTYIYMSSFSSLWFLFFLRICFLIICTVLHVINVLSICFMVVLFLTHLKKVDITLSNEESFCTDVFKVKGQSKTG